MALGVSTLGGTATGWPAVTVSDCLEVGENLLYQKVSECVRERQRERAKKTFQTKGLAKDHNSCR